MTKHEHDHNHGAGINERRITIAFVIILVFMLVEIVGGLISNSLALLADAGHMVSDALALGISWTALRIGKRPADTQRTYGYQRLEVLAAFVNGCALFVIAGWIIYEAAWRLASPPQVMGRTMLVVAVAGLIANIAAFFVLNGGDRENLNVRSAWVHVLGDLLGSLAAIIAAGIILVIGWTLADPLLSVLVALLILKSAYQIVRSSAQILLEGTPPDLNLEELTQDLNGALPEGASVHHVHAWSLTAGQVLATLHVQAAPDHNASDLIASLKARLHNRFGIEHSTIQVERADCHDDDDHCGQIDRARLSCQTHRDPRWRARRASSPQRRPGPPAQPARVPAHHCRGSFSAAPSRTLDQVLNHNARTTPLSRTMLRPE